MLLCGTLSLVVTTAVLRLARDDKPLQTFLGIGKDHSTVYRVTVDGRYARHYTVLPRLPWIEEINRHVFVWDGVRTHVWNVESNAIRLLAEWGRVIDVSPDTQWAILYDNDDLYLTRIDDSEQVLIHTIDSQAVVIPSALWSYDGRWLYLCDVETLHMINLETLQKSLIMDPCPFPRLLSPDGSWLLLFEERLEEDRLWRVPVGSVERELLLSMEGTMLLMTLSPDGEWVYVANYTRTADDEFENHLYRMRLDGSPPQLVLDDGPWGKMVWSPDGIWLVFGRRDRGIYAMHADGSAGHWLTEVDSPRIKLGLIAREHTVVDRQHIAPVIVNRPGISRAVVDKGAVVDGHAARSTFRLELVNRPAGRIRMIVAEGDVIDDHLAAFILQCSAALL